MISHRFQQPLVSRPAYGSNYPISPVAESGLPQGDPGGKGLSLDSDIPGTNTFSKPVNEPARETNKAEPGSIYRIDGPDDRSKPQDDAGLDERIHDQFKPTFNGPGGRPKDEPKAPRGPYRDDRHHPHTASDHEFIVALYRLASAREAAINLDGTRVAVRIDAILQGINPKTQESASKCSVAVKRVDTGNLRWIFAVNCGNGPKAVRLKAARQGNIVKLAKMDLTVSCSCPAWQYLGPEFHSKGEQYLDGKPRGTASTPNIRDPQRHNRVCKHVAAVMSQIRGWTVPKPKSEEM